MYCKFYMLGRVKKEFRSQQWLLKSFENEVGETAGRTPIPRKFL